MTLAGRFLRRRLLAPYIFFVCVLTGVLWSLEGVQLVQTLLARGAITSTLQALGWSLPTVLTAVVPIAMACAGVLVCSRLHDDGENAALQAAGISPMRLTVPFIQIGVVNVALLLALQIWLVPIASKELRLLLSTMQPQELATLLKEGTTISPTNNVTMLAQTVRGNGELGGVFIEDKRDAKRTIIYTAQRASFKPTLEGSRLFLEQGTVQIENNLLAQWPPVVDVLSFERFVYNPNRTDLQTAQPRKLREMTFQELIKPDNTLSSADKKRYRARAHEQITAAFYPLVFCLIIAALGLRPQPRRFSSMKRLLIASALLLLVRMVGILLQNSAIHASSMLILTYVWPLLVMGGALYIVQGGKWHKYMP